MDTGAQRKHRSKRPEANCAVCASASAMRCSRCKVVSYCSARCQIIDWRMHHKQECHPPNVDPSSSTQEMAHNSDLADMKSHESKNYDVSVAFRSKVESLYELFDEMESSLGTRKSEVGMYSDLSNLHFGHSLLTDAVKISQKEDVRASTSHQSTVDRQSKEMAILQAKLDYVMAERDTLRSEVKLLKSELDMLQGFQHWTMEEEDSGLEMNDGYKSPPGLLTYLEQKLEIVLGQSSLTG